MDAATQAIHYAVSRDSDSGLEYLRYWLQGDFDTCRQRWPDAPVSCYIGSHPDMPAALADADFAVIATLVDLWTGNTFSAARDLHAFSEAAKRTLGFALPAAWTGQCRIRMRGSDHWLECQIQENAKLRYQPMQSYASAEAAQQMLYRLNRIHGKARIYFQEGP